MRKTLLVILIGIISFEGMAQKDTTQKLEFPGDSIPVLTIRQINVVLKEMRRVVTLEQSEVYDLMLVEIQKQLDLSVAEWRKRKKKN